jgi:hypothetical protein
MIKNVHLEIKWLNTGLLLPIDTLCHSRTHNARVNKCTLWRFLILLSCFAYIYSQSRVKKSENFDLRARLYPLGRV